MSYTHPNRSPEGCRAPRCARLEERSVGSDHHDRCTLQIPMHQGCIWHRTPEQSAAIAAQEQMTLSRAQQPMRGPK